MNRRILFLCCFISLSAFGQHPELSQELKDRYYSDSIPVGVFDNRLFDSLKLANKEHPSRFYQICGSFIMEGKLNEAAVAFFIARNRYKLYNKTNPKYEASGDGALAGSFAYMYGDALNQYLTKNLTNYGEVVQLSGSWYQKNQYFYFKNKENDSLYQLQTNALLKMADKLLNNPEEYIQQLEEQRKNLEELLKQINETETNPASEEEEEDSDEK